LFNADASGGAPEPALDNRRFQREDTFIALAMLLVLASICAVLFVLFG
jgi:hypothetical protein